MKFDRSLLLMIVYGLFTLLYSIYIGNHPVVFGNQKGTSWWYYLKFLLIGNYFFFILQGIILRSKNWGILLLLPIGLLAATIIAGYIMVGIIRMGGGDLLDKDIADRILAALIFLTGSYFALRLIKPGRRGRRR
ncbi:hypothetical protein ACX0G9_01400 [Flavitalea flava]